MLSVSRRETRAFRASSMEPSPSRRFCIVWGVVMRISVPPFGACCCALMIFIVAGRCSFNNGVPSLKAQFDDWRKYQLKLVPWNELHYVTC